MEFGTCNNAQVERYVRPVREFKNFATRRKSWRVSPANKRAVNVREMSETEGFHIESHSSVFGRGVITEQKPQIGRTAR